MKEMYANYVEECRKDSRIETSCVTYSRQIKDMNISFAKLGCEECEICDEHNIHMGFTNNEKEEKFDMLETCERECEKCTSWKDHYAKYRETRLAYKEVKNLVGNYGNTLFLSADTQKVILLPRLPGYKICLFTKRIVVINQSFAPINKEEVNKKRSLGVLWHEGISGRNDEDVTSITLKYFVVGHTFMSADSFHHKVEGEMKKMKNVCDWSDFTRCVQKAGQIVEMDIQDFKEHESGLTQSKASKKTRPLLDTVTAVRFEEGSFALNYKTSHSDQEYRKAIFLQKKVLTRMANNTYTIKSRPLPRGICHKKKEDIIQKLGPLMKPSRVQFFEELLSKEDIPDMMDQY